MGLAARWHGDHQHLGRVEHALHLELHEIVLALAQGLGGAHALLLDEGVNAFAQVFALDADEAPRLHEAHARCVVCGAQQAQQNVFGNRAATEMAHVAALVNRTIDRRALGFAEGV